MNNKTLLKFLTYTSLMISWTTYADDTAKPADVRTETPEGEIPADALIYDYYDGGPYVPYFPNLIGAEGDGASGTTSGTSGNYVSNGSSSSTTTNSTSGTSGTTNSSGTTSSSGVVVSGEQTGTSNTTGDDQFQVTNNTQANSSTSTTTANGQTASDPTQTSSSGSSTANTNTNSGTNTSNNAITGTNSLGDIVTNTSSNNAAPSNTNNQNWGAPPQEEYADHWAVTRPHISVLIDISNKVKHKTKLKFNCTSNGCAVDNGDNTITYTSSASFVGSSGIAKAIDTFTYTYTAEDGQSKTGIVKVMVMEDSYYWNFVSNWNMGGYWTYNDSKSSYWDYVGRDQNGNYYSQGSNSYYNSDNSSQNWVYNNNPDSWWSYDGNSDSNNTNNSILTDPEHWSYDGNRDKDSQYYGSKPSDFLTWSVPAACQLIYAVHDEGLRDSQLLTIDPKKGYTSVPLGPMHKSYDIEAMGISPTNHRLYALSGGSANKDYRGNLFVVDPRTGDLAPLGKSGFDDITAIAFHPNGTLWAWSKGIGIIQINPETGQGIIRARFTTLEMEGLAWSTDGSVLYATENENLWIYTGGSLAKTCNNFPGQVEALETLSDGLLLFAVDKDQGNNIYAYDPQTCSVVTTSSFITLYSDIESIAWASRCYDEYSELSAWSGEFNHTQGFLNEAGDELVCVEKPQWITATATISLNPLPSLAHLETGWEIVSPQQTTCPPKKDQYGHTVQYAEDNCTTVTNPLQMTTGKSEFSISGWWPGMSKDAQEVTEVVFKAHILDLNGNPLPGYETPITQRVRGVCGAEDTDTSETLVNVAVEKAQPAIDTAALEQYFYDVLKATDVTIDEDGKVTAIIDKIKYSGMLSTLLPETDTSNSGTLGFKQVPDINADGYDDYIVTYPDGQQQQLFYLGAQPIEETVDEEVAVEVDNTTEIDENN